MKALQSEGVFHIREANKKNCVDLQNELSRIPMATNRRVSHRNSQSACQK